MNDEKTVQLDLSSRKLQAEHAVLLAHKLKVCEPRDEGMIAPSCKYVCLVCFLCVGGLVVLVVGWFSFALDPPHRFDQANRLLTFLNVDGNDLGAWESTLRAMCQVCLVLNTCLHVKPEYNTSRALVDDAQEPRKDRHQ